MFQIDLSPLGTTLPSVIPRDPDVVLKDAGEAVAWKYTGSVTNTAHRLLGVQKLITFNLRLMLLAQTHGRCFH